MSDLLEEATRALREQLVDEPEDALRCILASLDAADVLDDAVVALRRDDERTDGAETLARIQRTLGRDVLDEATAALRDAPQVAPPRRESSGRASRRAIWAAACLAVLFSVGAPTAWAWTSGRLDPWLASVGLIEVRTLEAVAAPAPERADTEPVAPEPSPPEELADTPTAEPVPPTPARRRRAASAPAVDTTPADDAETQLFAEAHHAHFVDRAPTLALAGWDRYLSAYPGGRYEPEARYNRALSLARLGRHSAARDALAPFALGIHGSYRRAEAQQLVQALDARMNDGVEDPR